MNLVLYIRNKKKKSWPLVMPKHKIYLKDWENQRLREQYVQEMIAIATRDMEWIIGLAKEYFFCIEVLASMQPCDVKEDLSLEAPVVPFVRPAAEYSNRGAYGIASSK